MKKIVSSLVTLCFVAFLLVAPQNVKAEETADSSAIENAEMNDAEDVESVTAVAEEGPENTPPTFTEELKKRFLEGGIGFMVIVLLCLIMGVSIAIERIIYLSLGTVNTKRLLSQLDDALANGGVESAKEICRNTRGPVGSIFYEGLERADEGADAVEKAIISGGSVQMGMMEKGVSWISLFIALAPMLGFLGTVIGMIESFDAIEQAGGIKPTVVAGGIKTALITTVAGLIVAIILQVFYNVIVAKIDNLVNSMEDASNVFVKIVKTRLS